MDLGGRGVIAFHEVGSSYEILYKILHVIFIIFV